MAHRHEHLCSASQLWLPHLALCVVPPECFRDLHIWSGAVGSKSSKLRYIADHDNDSQHLLVMDLVVALYVRESLRHEGNGLVHAICLCLGEYCSGHKVGGVTFEVEVAILRWEAEDGWR